ncbi:MAG: alpha/beta hydrolase [Phycisphaerales bacterium]
MADPIPPATTVPPAPSAGRVWRRRLTRLLVILVSTYGLYGCALVSLQDRMIFPREVPGKRDPDGKVPGRWTELAVTGDEGSTVPCWLRLPLRQPPGVPAPLVIWFHGNAEVIDDVAGYAELKIYDRLGVAVLLVEYRGYGRASGQPSEKAITDDSIRMYDLVTACAGIDATRVVYYGRSLGGGAACALAKARPPRALILQSSFTSVADIAGRFGIPWFLVKHPFRNDRVVRSYPGPVLVFHGTRDSIIPFSHAERLAKAAKDATLVTQPCDHNDFPTDPAGYHRAIEAFFRKAGVIEAEGGPGVNGP